MTNTFFAPGEQTKDDLIAGVDRGLYAVSFGGGQVEPATGDFVFGVSEAYLIEGGKVTSPVRGATLTGNGLEALAAVDGIPDYLIIATGFCGNAPQRVAGDVASLSSPRLAEWGTARKSELAIAVERAARARKGVSQVEETLYADAEGAAAIAHSRGFAASFEQTIAYAWSSAFAGEGRDL